MILLVDENGIKNKLLIEVSKTIHFRNLFLQYRNVSRADKYIKKDKSCTLPDLLFSLEQCFSTIFATRHVPLLGILCIWRYP